MLVIKKKNKKTYGMKKKHPFYEYEISQLLQGLTPSFGLTGHHHGYVKRTQKPNH